MNKTMGQQISVKRKKMGLSQRKTASMIEKMYGVKLSHSYLSLIEGDRVDSIGEDLKDALEHFFKISPEETSTPQFHRMPLYENARVIDYLDMAGPILADFAVSVCLDRPEWGIFAGDILVCRKEEPVEGDLLITPKEEIFAYIQEQQQDFPAAKGKVILILKNSVTARHFEAAINSAASALSVEQLIRELARKTGLREIDLVRSLAVLNSFAKDIRNGVR